jgi:hypothetical protein
MTNDDNIFETINGKRCLKDGARLRVKTSLMDHRTDDQAWITDANGNAGLFLHRPGWRCLLSDDAGAAAKEAMYQQYDADLVSAYKQDAPPAGAYPLSAGEGQSCTINGMTGTLVKEGGWLVCKPN